MPWVKRDDGTHDSAKVTVLSDAAFRLWDMALCWSNKPENEAGGGFIPKALLPKISENRWPKKLAALAKELVDCGGSVKKLGLWETADGGWQIHDWHEYRQQKGDRLSREEAASLAGKASAEARRNKTGTAQPVRRSNDSERPDDVRTTFGDSFDEQRSEDVRPNEPSNVRTPEPVPDPVPGSDLKITKPAAKAPHEASGGLASRLISAIREPGQPPLARKDPEHEAVAFSKWGPSQQMLDWAREVSLPDAEFDGALADVRTKHGTKRYTVEKWDGIALGFLGAALKKLTKPPTTRELLEGPGPASADAVARKERAEKWLEEETNRKLGLASGGAA